MSEFSKIRVLYYVNNRRIQYIYIIHTHKEKTYINFFILKKLLFTIWNKIILENSCVFFLIISKKCIKPFPRRTLVQKYSKLTKH